ncbi:Cyclic nucleotide binding regulatory protein [Sulfitobacter noctilucicola]|uniref:CRP-like cAMP-binding protein n=1 Tax=Sulfitobacter noctilucicola TaxID=1342301 RepID=A0A7W6Q434_9RHOB|nr:Crp/Fnr family transcriptional regulator [Sulfitobacter noctilucicola]KIN62966.1 Cyclic nucleotide binding regulatory protein [Sulfitobacter noctilucicola]MBB4172507.1 CRP-like cAMP-binding protein [Sulfitobacter noctilucicola]
MDLRTFLMQSPDLLGWASADEFASAWKQIRLDKGAHLTRQEHSQTDEFILLAGCLASSICDQDGKEVCVGFYVGPCVVTPNIARTRNGLSLVSIVATTDARLARVESDKLSDRMIASEPVRNWANGILREALSRKVDREWCLAALGGAERLAWFRKEFPGYEDIFPHTLIASFLGVTPVTLSRLRASDKTR